jgi:hypothetical protein
MLFYHYNLCQRRKKEVALSNYFPLIFFKAASIFARSASASLPLGEELV